MVIASVKLIHSNTIINYMENKEGFTQLYAE